MKNDYGSLCTQMYELLHPKADGQELDFYLSYAGQGQKILEPLCGSGRFLIPFLERGYDITGVDLSRPMLEKLKEKAPDAKAVQADLIQYAPEEQFDYIFIPAGSRREICIFCGYHSRQKPGGCSVSDRHQRQNRGGL